MTIELEFDNFTYSIHWASLASTWPHARTPQLILWFVFFFIFYFDVAVSV